MEGATEAAVPGDLQRLVHGIGYVVRFPNGAEAFKGPDRVQVDAWIRRCDRESRLIDVRFSLQMQPAASDVTYAEK